MSESTADTEVASSRDRDCDLLIVAAFAPELVGFSALLGPAMRAEIGGLMVVARPVGIGLVSAATGMSARLALRRPRAVVLVGTCGAFPSEGDAATTLDLGDVIVGRSVSLVEPAVVEGEAAFPEPMSARASPHAALSAAIAAGGARLEAIATTLAVTTSDRLAERLGRDTETRVEHLEAFAVATACAAHDVPFAVALAIANVVGSGGRAEWHAHHGAAGLAAANYIARWVQAGAAGVPHRS